MPLLQPVLAQALIALDEPTPPTSPLETAEAWFRAWWTYAQQMTHFLPGPTLLLAEAAARPVFVAALLPGCVPGLPGTFFLALEVAQLAAWAAAGLVPLALLPALLPGIVPVIPAPGILATALIATVPLGLASPTKHPPRIAIAAAIDVWTRLLGVVPVGPLTPVPLI